MTSVLADTIYALSSGRPPAGIAVVRISGSSADIALDRLIGRRPRPRVATLAEVRHPEDAALLDRALALWMPGPDTATGEDVAELHLHGGRAVVDAVSGALTALGLRAAEPGEFTRRAFENGRIDLNEADGLADLLMAETEGQRRSAVAAMGGSVSRLIEGWRGRLLDLAAEIEAVLDFSDEDDVPDDTLAPAWTAAAALVADIGAYLVRPPAERMRDGVRVVLAGPVNSGKSTLLNALVQREAAIASPIAGTTRDVIEVPVVIGGVPLILIDTAGLREAEDAVEAIGVSRAHNAVEGADIVLWLGAALEVPACNFSIIVHARADEGGPPDDGVGLAVSAITGFNIDALTQRIVAAAATLLPVEDEVTLNRRQRDLIAAMSLCLERAAEHDDAVLVAEEVRSALRCCDMITGASGVEDMLSALFGRFCVGK